MKKKMILLAGSLMALAAVTTTVVATSSNDEASLLMQNVEAIARYEMDPIIVSCDSGGCGDCWIPRDGLYLICERTSDPRIYCSCY